LKKKKVFIGLSNIAGVSSRFKKGFDEIGVPSDFYSFSEHVFGYTTDKIIKYSENPFVRKIQKFFLLIKLILKYDYFIFVHPESLLKNFRDIRILRFFGKKTMMVFTGCDVRIPAAVEKYKWNPCTFCTQEYKEFVNCVIPSKLEVTERIENIFDLISCPMEAGGNLKRKFYPGYFPVDLDIFPNEKYKNYSYHQPLKILHAPTHETYKGSKHIYDAVEKLKVKHDIDFMIVKNVSIDEFYEQIGKADIVIDQMLLGSFGFVSIESMAMYRPVINYMRNDIWEIVGSDCPIINANPDTLVNVLENIIINPSQLPEISLKSRKYVETYWEKKKVAANYYELFEKSSN
jgi:hypothetical protein